MQSFGRYLVITLVVATVVLLIFLDNARRGKKSMTMILQNLATGKRPLKHEIEVMNQAPKPSAGVSQLISSQSYYKHLCKLDRYDSLMQ